MLIICCFHGFSYEKFGFENSTNVLGSLTLSGLTGVAYNMDRICILEKSHKKFHVRFVSLGKTLTDFQIFVCELHQNAFGGRDPPVLAGGAIALP